MRKSNLMKSRLLLGAGTALIATLAATAANADTLSVNSQVNATVDGALVSDQNGTSNVTASSTGASVTTGTDTAIASSANVDSNKAGASASGNVDTLIYSDIGSANSATGVAAGARQTNGTINVEATSAGTLLQLTTGVTAQSSLSVKNNSDTATAAANTIAQSLTLDSANLALGNGNGTVSGSAIGTTSSLTGDALASSLQTNDTVTVNATDSGSTIRLGTNAVVDSSLAVTGNTQAATATGSSAANGIALTGVNLGTGVVLESVQKNLNTDITGATDGSTALTVGSTLANSSLALSGNRLQSQATGVTSANTLSLSGTNATLPSAAIAPAATVNSMSDSSTVTASYGTLNTQSVDGNVTATTAGEVLVPLDPALPVYNTIIGGNATNSAVATDGNLIAAKAQGAVTANTTSVTLGASLDAGGTPLGVAEGTAIASNQTVTNGSNISATIGDSNSSNDGFILNSLGAKLTDSSLSASNNLVQANAEATNAINALVANATSLSTAGDPTAAASTQASVSGVTADAAFSVANAQKTGTGSVSSEISTGSIINNRVQSDVSNSMVAANGNQFAGFAVADKATNSLAVSGTNVSTDTALVNAQQSGADVSANLGKNGAFGVTTDMNGNVTNSQIAVNGNSAVGSSVNNSAANTLAVSATSLSGTGPNVRANITPGSTEADNSLTNLQVLDSTSSSKTLINAAFDIRQDPAQLDLTDSKLSVSGNTQFAESLGNSATNKLSSTATDVGAGIAPTAALSNAQEADTLISSTSNMTAYANAASSGSSVAINGNSNTALGVVNNGSNTLNVSGTNVTNRGSRGSAGTGLLEGDYALANVQSAAGVVDSSATTSLYNVELSAAATNGLNTGSVAINGNATTAEGSGNRVANLLSVSATATNGASAVLGNSQDNAAAVNSTADTWATYALASDNGAPSASSSLVSVDGNSTTAIARGNTANNTLNYSAGAQYTGTDAPAGVTSGIGTSAQAGLTNLQNNNGAVGATSVSASYSIALNEGLGGAGAALNSSASLSGNSTSALAYGNSAVNSLNMATFGQGIPSSAVSSYQTNSGAVSATATNVSYTSTFGGATNNSAIRSTGNSVTAQAVGNSSISSIGGQ